MKAKPLTWIVERRDKSGEPNRWCAYCFGGWGCYTIHKTVAGKFHLWIGSQPEDGTFDTFEGAEAVAAMNRIMKISRELET